MVKDVFSMAITAKLQHLRIAARKVRLVADLVRRKPVAQAEAILRFTNRKASKPLLKLLHSAMANAKNNYKLDPNEFYIAKLTVNDGPMQKRVLPRSRGRADRIERKTSHITLILEKQGAKKKKDNK